MDVTVSTIIPAYNCEETLARALDSILDQTHPPDEIIVVNDGSTDGTARVIESYAKMHPTIRGITQENSGPAVARNHGVKMAGCEWVSFLDSDDYWFPWHLENLIAVIETHPDLAWAAAAYEKEKVSRITKPLSKSSAVLSYLRIAHHPQNPVHTNTLLIRRSVFEECGGFRQDWRRAEDLWLWLQISLRYSQLGYSPVCSSFYSYQPSSLTNQEFSYEKELNLTISNTDRILEDLASQGHLEREDAQVYIGDRISKILFLSLFVSYRKYRTSRNKYRVFLSRVHLPFHARIYIGLSLFGISPLRVKATVLSLRNGVCSLIRKTHRQTEEFTKSTNVSLAAMPTCKNRETVCHSEVRK